MSIVELKIKVGDAVKTMRFPPETYVSAVCKQITDNKATEGGPDHALFLPAIEGMLHHPKWLAPDKTLQFYDLQTDMTLEYRKKHRLRKVKLLDQTVKTILLDESKSVADCVEIIGAKIGIKNSEEFSLQKEGGGWLNSILILGEIPGLAEDAVLVLKKKFFFSDANIDRTDPVQVHMLYIQCRDAIMEDQYPATKEEARDLAAIQAQITYGDYSPDRKINLKEFLPHHWRHGAKGIKKQIAEEYRKLAGMTEFNAKYRYIQLCRSLKTYGITTFEVKIRDPAKVTKTKEVLFGVTRESCLILDPDTKEVQVTHKLSHIKRYAAADSAITFDFGDYGSEYLVVYFPDCEQITDLISGYIDITLKAKADPGKGQPVNNERSSAVIATEEKVVRVNAVKGITSTAYAAVGALGRWYNGAGAHVPASQKIAITDLASAVRATELLLAELDSASKTPRRPTGQGQAPTPLSPEDYKAQLAAKANTVANLAKTILDDFNQPPTGGMQTLRRTLVSKCQQLMSGLSVVATNAQNAVHVHGVQAPAILDAAKKLVAAVSKLLKAAAGAAADGQPGTVGEDVNLVLTKATFEAHAASLLMNAACDHATPPTEDMLEAAKNKPKVPPLAKNTVSAAAKANAGAPPSPKSARSAKGKSPHSPKLAAHSLRTSHSPKLTRSPRSSLRRESSHSPRFARASHSPKAGPSKYGLSRITPPAAYGVTGTGQTGQSIKTPTAAVPKPTPAPKPLPPQPDGANKPEPAKKPEPTKKPEIPKKAEKEKEKKPEKEKEKKPAIPPKVNSAVAKPVGATLKPVKK